MNLSPGSPIKSQIPKRTCKYAARTTDESQVSTRLYNALNRFGLVRPLGLVTLAAFSCYLLWRATTTIVGANPALAAGLFITELLVLVELGADIFRYWPRTSSASAAESPIPPGEVTAIITVDDEPEDLVRVTALTVSQSRPAFIVLVGTHHRPRIADLAQRIGASYNCLPAGHNPNQDPEQRVSTQNMLVNWILPQVPTKWIQLVSPGEFPHPEAASQVNATDKTAVVVLGQRIADTNSLEVAANLIWERNVELQIERPARVARNLLDWVEGPCFVRTAALAEMGGLVEQSNHRRSSGRVLMGNGWSISASNTDQAVGPGSPHLGAMLATTLHRLRGSIEASRYDTRNLNLAQQINNLVAYMPVASALRRIGQTAVIALVLTTNLAPATVSIEQLATVVAPIYLLRGLARSMYRGGLVPWWPAYMQELRTLSANLAILAQAVGFVVRTRLPSPRLRIDPGGRHAARILPVQLILVAILDMAVIYASLGTFLNQGFGAKGLLFLAFSSIAVFHITGLTLVVTSAVTRKQMRTLSRLRVSVDLKMDDEPARAIDLTSGGIGLVSRLTKTPGEQVELELEVDDQGPIRLRACASHVSPLEGTDGLNVIGLSFINVDSQESDLDRLYLYCGVTWPFRRLAELDAARPN